MKNLLSTRCRNRCTQFSTWKTTKHHFIRLLLRIMKHPDYHGFGRRFCPSQSNNAYVYPGVCLGVLTAGLHHVPDSVFLNAAEVLAGAVTEQELAEGR